MQHDNNDVPNAYRSAINTEVEGREGERTMGAGIAGECLNKKPASASDAGFSVSPSCKKMDFL